jgi:hypothetical protein
MAGRRGRVFGSDESVEWFLRDRRAEAAREAELSRPSLLRGAATEASALRELLPVSLVVP